MNQQGIEIMKLTEEEKRILSALRDPEKGPALLTIMNKG